MTEQVIEETPVASEHSLQLDNVSHWFDTKNSQFDPDTKRVLYNLDLKILKGQFTALVGPSGCGKSTLFRAILGTHPPCTGVVSIDGEEVTRPNRNVGIVYQHYSLYDFMTAEKNVAFGPKLDQSNTLQRMFMPWHWFPMRKQHIEQAKEWLVRLDLERAIGHYPSELSGGMRQRVAIAQALIMKPKVILLDEPFGALDEGTREDLQKMLLTLYQENLAAKAKGEEPPYTVIMVTHELNEAFYIADRLIGLSQYWRKDRVGSRRNEDGLHLGSTICYDKACPIFTPDDERDFSRFAEQKEELRDAVFSQKSIDPDIHRTFWDDRAKSNEERV